MLSKVWNKITYPSPNFNNCPMEIWQWISDCIYFYVPLKVDVYCWENKQMHGLKNRLPVQVHNLTNLRTHGQHLHALGMCACLNVKPCDCRWDAITNLRWWATRHSTSTNMAWQTWGQACLQMSRGQGLGIYVSEVSVFTFYLFIYVPGELRIQFSLSIK